MGAITATLEHLSPGRMRARVDRRQRTPEAMERIKRELAECPAIQHVEVNAATGSVLVRGHDMRELEQALTGTLTLARSLSGEGSPEQGVDQVVRIVRRAEGGIRARTGGKLSLRWLVPALFVGVGLRELWRQGLTVGAVPWYVLLYYGVDSFLKLYPEHAPAGDADTGDSAGES